MDPARHGNQCNVRPKSSRSELARAPSLVVATLLGCGPSLADPLGDGLDTGSTDTGAPGRDASGTGGASPATMAASSGTDEGRASGDDATTDASPPPFGPMPTRSPEATYGWNECRDGAPALFVMVFVDDVSFPGCMNPGGENGELLIFSISPWNGLNGTFMVEMDGQALARLRNEPVVGELEVVVSEPWRPSWARLSMLEPEPAVEVLDLATCFDEGPPCPSPDGRGTGSQ